MKRKIIACVLLLVAVISAAYAAEGKKALMVIASQDFRDEELLTPKEILESKGVKVTIASSSLDTATGMLGAKVKPDILIADVNVNDFDAVIFVGGAGAREYFNNPVALKIARDAYKRGKLVGAICIAPRVLSEAGILKGKKATVYSSEAKALKAKGAIYTGRDVEVDGKVVTASGPQAAEQFGKTIVNLLK